MTEMLEVPNLLKDMADPCTETYYPTWSTRGMRSVRCTRPAKATLYSHYDETHRRVCGIHANHYDNDERFTIEGRVR